MKYLNYSSRSNSIFVISGKGVFVGKSTKKDSIGWPDFCDVIRITVCRSLTHSRVYTQVHGAWSDSG